MISLKTRLRHWWQLRDSETWFVVKLFSFLILAYSVVGSMDYADEQRIEAERHQEARNRAEMAFLDCLNGKPVAQTDKAVIVCSKAWEVLK